MDIVIGRFALVAGSEGEWDDAFRERVRDGESAPGWQGVALYVPEDAPSERVVVGRWRDRSDYESWIAGAEFQVSKARMDPLQTGPPDIRWYRLVHEARG